ncbi:outer membrane protein assembly factor BamB family protein [Polystyrenella longa]|nr:PQQ-binding-like beta-propeller repeat protein [Polystyrenella longa]
MSSSLNVHAADWNSFRNGGNSTAEGNYPTSWSPDSGVAWQRETPGYGQSCPVIKDDHIFVTAVIGNQKETCLIICYRLVDGDEVWKYSHDATSTGPSTYMMSRAAPTPIVDDRGVYAFFENGDVMGVDHSGNKLWSRSLTQEYGAFDSRHGLGSSPAHNADSLFLNVEHGGESYLLAIDKQTGENMWKAARPSGSSWTSPVVAETKQGEQLVVSSNETVSGFAAETGKLLWSLEGIAGNSVPSPLVHDNRILIGARASEFGSASAAAKSNLCFEIPDSSSSVPDIIWRARKAVCHYASPVYCEGCAYFLNDGGILYCLDWETGEEHYVKRIGTSCWTTPVVVDDRLFFFGKDGQTVIIRGGPKYQSENVSQLWNPEEPPVPEEYQEAASEQSSADQSPADSGPSRFLKRLLGGDTNDDGQLSREELPVSMQSSFEKTDLNADGVLDQDELGQIEVAFRKRRENSRSSSRDPIVYGVSAANGRFVVRTGTRLFCISGDETP